MKTSYPKYGPFISFALSAIDSMNDCRHKIIAKRLEDNKELIEWYDSKGKHSKTYEIEEGETLYDVYYRFITGNDMFTDDKEISNKTSK